jgi:hypothetical protein
LGAWRSPRKLWELLQPLRGATSCPSRPYKTVTPPTTKPPHLAINIKLSGLISRTDHHGTAFLSPCISTRHHDQCQQQHTHHWHVFAEQTAGLATRRISSPHRCKHDLFNFPVLAGHLSLLHFRTLRGNGPQRRQPRQGSVLAWRLISSSSATVVERKQRLGYSSQKSKGYPTRNCWNLLHERHVIHKAVRH